jgi:hypothetical protein
MSTRGWSVVETIGGRLVHMGVKNGQGFIHVGKLK